MEYTIGTKVLNDWEIVRLIGEGAFGKVYEIQKNNYGVVAKAALKVIHIPYSSSDVKAILQEGMDEVSVTSYFQGFVQEIVNEISIMTSLKGHANIVSCEDYSVVEYEDTIGWDILIRMELLTPMQDYLEHHSMSERDVIRLGQDLCQALVICQKKGLIHRDIKPGNIFVNEEGQFKLGDFGIARSAEKTAGGLSKKGTESYMAPEVYLGKPYGLSVDIYSVGLVLYKLMNNNRLPFLPPISQPIRYEDRENSLRCRINGEEIPKPELASLEFAEVILKACAYESKDRYRTAEEMLEALQGLENLSEEENKEVILTKPQDGFEEKTLPDIIDDEKTLPDISNNDEERTLPEQQRSPIKDLTIETEKKSHRKVVMTVPMILVGLIVILIIAFKLLGSVGGEKFTFDDLERIYVYSEYDYGVSVFEEATKSYHTELEGASEAEYKELIRTFEDTPDVIQGLDAFEIIRNSNDKFIEYGPCAMYQTQDGDAHIFQLLLYESGYKMVECGFDSELSFNYLNFYIVTNLSAEGEIGVTFQSDSYELRKMK